jgi:hypothetical protein
MDGLETRMESGFAAIGRELESIKKQMKEIDGREDVTDLKARVSKIEERLKAC